MSWTCDRPRAEVSGSVQRKRRKVEGSRAKNAHQDKPTADSGGLAGVKVRSTGYLAQKHILPSIKN